MRPRKHSSPPLSPHELGEGCLHLAALPVPEAAPLLPAPSPPLPPTQSRWAQALTCRLDARLPRDPSHQPPLGATPGRLIPELS